MPYCTGSSDCGPFVPDLAGSYIGELFVRDEFGQSATISAVQVAEPTPALWVELSWTLEADDLDLHLLAPGGEPNTETDCYWATCQWSTPDWGEPGVAEDDPAMDLDDIEGTGPEVVEIPLPAAGVYTVFVHDFTGSNPEVEDADPEEPNEATVRVYADGQLAFTRTVEIEGEGAQEYVCEATWPDGTVEPY